MEQSLKTETLLQLTESIRELNRGASVRFSGLIGEPLLPRDIVKVFEAVNDKGLSWGLTTNGIRMDGDRLRRSMLKATYVHVSVDAGSDETYQRLKKGQAGDFDKVIKNIALLARTKRLHRYGPEIIVSFLLQEMNYGELPSLAVRAKAVGVDTLEVKMQHFDKRRVMSKEAVDAAYLLIDTLRGDMSDGGFRVVVVQERDEALHKIEEDAGRISFSRCYANLLGLNATVDPTGEVQACCQYYQRTLGPMGNITQDSFETIWHGDRRRDRLQDDPREHCINCSPSDEFVNQFVEFLRLAHRRDPEFLNWVEEEALVGANGRSGLT